MWFFFILMGLCAIAWMTLGNFFRRLNVPVQINCQLALLILGVLAVVYYLMLLQQPSHMMMENSAMNKEEKKIFYARVGAKETEPEVIFKQGVKGYNTSRIPALVYHKDTFLAFCEARRDTARDIGHMDIILRRGRRQDWQVEWGDVQVVATRQGYRSMNPVPIVDKTMDIIILVFIQIPAHIDQVTLMKNGVYNQLVLVTRSFDNGETWTMPQDITESTIARIKPKPAIYAPGPGHGIQMSNGRLVVPGNYFVKDEIGKLLHNLDNMEDNTNYANVMFSDDYGESWRLGGRIPFGVDPIWRPIHASESMVVEIDHGQLVLNARTLHADLLRVQSRSIDDGETFSTGELVKGLVEPGYKIKGDETIPSRAAGCQASLIGFPAPADNKANTWVLFSNPASPKFRERLSIRISQDGCQTWSPPWKIHPTASGYSDLTYFESRDPVTGLNSQNFGIIFEGGKELPHEAIMFKMFNLEALERGLDILKMHQKKPFDDHIEGEKEELIHKKQRGEQAWLNMV
ncbi:sialidase-2-like isoform X2 [Amphiura filiformis]|uniref:sialidase-2-like isoform X2 n=1 Tax=Amphiura filiformis TaxID=82378 RepID=UPI003B210FBE